MAVSRRRGDQALGAKGFGAVDVLDGHRIRVGTALPDVKVATAAAESGIDGLTFYRGIPGGIGGALYMNAGCYGSETRERVAELRAVTRDGEIVTLSNADMGYLYTASRTARAGPSLPRRSIRACPATATKSWRACARSRKSAKARSPREPSPAVRRSRIPKVIRAGG